MRKDSKFIIILGASLLASCATYGTPVPIDRPPPAPAPVREKAPEETRRDPDNFVREPNVSKVPESAPERTEPVNTAAVPERELPEKAELAAAPERVPEEEFSISQPILGKGRRSAEQLASFLVSINSLVDSEFAAELARLYVDEAALEGVNHDVAFSQMCLETGFLRFGGLVRADQNNFCGLGATGPGQPGLRFPNPRIGVRAQIQHLKGYATEEPLNQDLVDPRYRYVRYGAAPTLEQLAGTWAADKGYAHKIVDILKRLYAHKESAAIAEKT
jgi:hypothetical protein